MVLSLVMSIFESVVMLPLHLSNERKPCVKGKEVKRAFVIKMEAAYRTFHGVLNRRYLVVFGFIAVFVFVMGLSRRVSRLRFSHKTILDVLWIKVRMPEGTALRIPRRPSQPLMNK